VKVSLDDDGFFYVEHVNRFQKDPDGVERELKTTASQDGKKCFVRIAKDPAQAGKWQIQYLVRQLRGYRVEGKPEHGSKLQRADPVAAQAKAGNIFLIQDKEGDRWIDAFLDELQNFPNGKHKDQVDALSGAVEDLLNLPPALGQKSVDW
jgi:predicted phage terminase large subunit-like protein